MKRYLTLLCLAWLGLGISDGSGDFGDFDGASAITALTQDEVDKYFTEYKVVGRQQDEGQCSQHVLDYRKKYEVQVNYFFLAKITKTRTQCWPS